MRRQARVADLDDAIVGLQHLGERAGGRGLLAEAHAEGAQAPQAADRVERRRRWRPGARRSPRSSRTAPGCRRPRRATRRCGRRSPWWPSAPRGRTPWSRGRWPSGVANVESTTVIGPAIAPSWSRSTRSRRGLAGVSASSTIVLPGRTAASHASGSVPSTKRHVDAEPGADGLQQHLRAGVELVLGHDVVALGAQPQDHRSDGPHAGAERTRRLGALELGDGLLEGVDRRVAVAAVEGRRRGRRGHASPLVDRLGHERGAGPHHRARGRTRWRCGRCGWRPSPAHPSPAALGSVAVGPVGSASSARSGRSCSRGLLQEGRHPGAPAARSRSGSRRGRAGSRCRPRCVGVPSVTEDVVDAAPAGPAGTGRRCAPTPPASER